MSSNLRYKTQICSNLGFCPNAEDCTFAHSLNELRTNSSYKTKLCRFLLTKGSCPHGDYCHYAHGEHEVRVHPNYKTAPCHRYQSTGECPSGAACVYYHNQSEMRKPGGGGKKMSDAMDKIVNRNKESTNGEEVLDRIVEKNMTFNSFGTITECHQGAGWIQVPGVGWFRCFYRLRDKSCFLLFLLLFTCYTTLLF